MNTQPIMRRIAMVCGCGMAMAMLFPVVSSASVARMTTTAVDAFPNYKIATILVSFPDNPAKPTADDNSGPWTKEYLERVLFTNGDSMAAYFASESVGALSVTGDVYDNHGSWYTVARPVASGDSCDWQTFLADAAAAADADIAYRDYNTIMMFTPMFDCATGGYATTMRSVPDTGGQSYRVAVMNASLNTYPHHELGHIIGFGHANSWQCDPPGILTGTNCRIVEYGDRYGIMGASSRMALLPASLKERMGWLKASEVTSVDADGDYAIQRYEDAGIGPKVLKIPQARDAAGNVVGWYYLEYRQPVGYDSISGFSPTVQELGIPNGALVRLGPVGDDMTTTLLDMTPGSRAEGLDIFEPTLQLGSSYSDAAANVSFGVLARNSTIMTVRVRFSAKSLCEWKAPTISMKGVKSRGKPKQELKYELTVKNNATLCGKQAVELRTMKKPTGWTVTIDKLKKKTIQLEPGKTQKIVVRIKSSRTAKPMRYAVNVEARMVAKIAMKKTTTLKPTILR